MANAEVGATLSGELEVRRTSSAVAIVRRGVVILRHRMPGAARVTRAGARGTTSALQQLPDSTLRWLAAGSIGLATGLQVAGAPRLVRVVGAAPALFMGAAIALRPPAPAVPAPVTAPGAGSVFTAPEESR